MVEINSLLNAVLPLTTTSQTFELVTKLASLFDKNHFSITIDFINIEMSRVLRLSKPCNTFPKLLFCNGNAFHCAC